MIITDNSFTVDPVRWGPHFWVSIDAIMVVLDPREEQSREFTLYFFHSLQGTIPCYECRDHYCSYYQEFPVVDVLSSKQQLMEWILRLKNRIRQRQEQPEWTMEQYLVHLKNVLGVDLLLQS